MDYKQGKWAKEIIGLQHTDGSWGYFHTLSNPTPKQPITTEQALRRLEILGYTIEDKPIKDAVKYLDNCLTGVIKTPDRDEKTHNWKIYTDLMLSTWIKIFTNGNKNANNIAEKWRQIISSSFAEGKYDHKQYTSVFENIFKTKLNPKAGRHIDFVHFYPISLLSNVLDKTIEAEYFRYILEHDTGMYYIYGNKLNEVPQTFQSKNVSGYIRAIEILAKYDNPECKKQLGFVVKWLKENMVEKDKWDMGKESKDGVNFPLSDSWRNGEDRIKDCTYRIGKLLERLKK